RNLPQPGEHLEAVHVRHHDVEQDQIHRILGTKTVESGRAVLAHVDVIGRGLQLELDDSANIRLVIDYEYVSGELGTRGHAVVAGPGCRLLRGRCQIRAPGDRSRCE